MNNTQVDWRALALELANAATELAAATNSVRTWRMDPLVGALLNGPASTVRELVHRVREAAK